MAATAAILSAQLLAAAPTDVDVVVTPLAVEGELPEQWVRTASEALDEGLSRAGLTVAVRDGVPCTDAACRRQRADGARYLVSGTLRVLEGGSDYALDVAVYSGATGDELSSLTGECSLCGYEEVVELVTAKAAAAGTTISAREGNASRFTFTSSPDGALVRIDGDKAGLTPLTVQLPPGSHDVRASKDGYSPQTFTVDAVEGVDKQLQFQLLPAPKAEPVAPPPPPGRPLVIAGAVLSAGSVAGFAAGGVLLAIDGREFQGDCQEDPLGNCRHLYGTQTGGIISLAIGGAALVTGVALLAVGLKRQRAAKDSSRRAQLRGGVLRF